jgi:hypothetical protein
MFDLDDALKSPYSPISPSYVPPLRMYHRAVVYHLRNGNGFNRPPAFSNIPPTEEIYKYGGPIVRVAVPENAAIEEIMICNNAFCSMCSLFQGSPATGDPDYNLHNLPFIHAKYIDAGNMSIIAPGSLTDTQFEAGGSRDLAAVPEKTLRGAEAINLLFSDGHHRTAIVCDAEKCNKCRV